MKKDIISSPICNNVLEKHTSLRQLRHNEKKELTGYISPGPLEK